VCLARVEEKKQQSKETSDKMQTFTHLIQMRQRWKQLVGLNQRFIVNKNDKERFKKYWKYINMSGFQKRNVIVDFYNVL
jgi:hypothetical protein